MDKIQKDLYTVTYSILNIYKKCLEDDTFKHYLPELEIVLQEEQSIYNSLSFYDYKNYLRKLNYASINEGDIYKVMNKQCFSDPTVRILNRLHHHFQTKAMFSEEKMMNQMGSYDLKYLRLAYVQNTIFFKNLLYYYQSFIKENQDLQYVLFSSLLNVSFHYPFLEQNYIALEKNTNLSKEKNLDSLFVFSGVEQIKSLVDYDNLHTLNEFLKSFLSYSLDAILGEGDATFLKMVVMIYLLTLYHSIENPYMRKSVIDSFSPKNYGYLSPEQLEFLEEARGYFTCDEFLERNLHL